MQQRKRELEEQLHHTIDAATLDDNARLTGLFVRADDLRSIERPG